MGNLTLEMVLSELVPSTNNNALHNGVCAIYRSKGMA